MNYNVEKYELALAMLILNIDNDFVSKKDLKKYTDEIELLNRKRNHLLKDKLELEKRLKLKKKKGFGVNNITQFSLIKKYNKLYKLGQFEEAKKGYESLIQMDSFYSFLEININKCIENLSKRES